MIQFDEINSHPKYNLITKTTFKIICLFVKLATHTHTHTHCQTQVMSLLNMILSCLTLKTVSTATQRRVENVQLTISDINNQT